MIPIILVFLFNQVRLLYMCWLHEFPQDCFLKSWKFYFHILQYKWKLPFFFFGSITSLQNHSRFDRKGEQVFLVILLENTPSHSTMIFWWSKTSNVKLIWRGSPISLSFWSGHSSPGGHHHGTGRRKVSSLGAHWYGHHWYVALHRQPHSRSRSHWHDPRRRGAHHWYHGRTPPCGVLASSLGKGVLGGWGEVGSLPLPEEEQSGIEGTCPCWNSSCFISQAPSLPFYPFLIVVFHILFVLPTTAACLSRRCRIVSQ